MKATHLILFLFVSCLCFSLQIRAQIISTVAGNGILGYLGDGTPATNAELHYPNGVIKDAAGNIYIADRMNNVVRKVDVAGIISTIAGTGTAGFGGDGGPASAALLRNPIDLAFDAAGNLYISDEQNSRIRMINSLGIISTVAGSASSGFSGDGGPATTATLNTPWGITIDAAGNLYIADELNERIRKVDVSGNISTIAGTGVGGYTGDGVPATSTELLSPADIWVDPAGNVLFTDFSNNRLRKINTSGIISTIAGTGTSGFTADGVPATSSELSDPVGIVMDCAGNIYIGDGHNNRVRKINTSGIISTIAGTGVVGYSGDGGQATAATLDYVYNLAIDAADNIYVGDASNNVVRMISGHIYKPNFTGGHNQTLVICENDPVDSINSLLAVYDTGGCHTDVWSVLLPAVHGTVVAAYSTTSTGSTLTPTGLSYTPTTGYIGTDSFKIRVTNGVASDTTTVVVTIKRLPNAGIITGIDSVCPGHTVALADAVSGGTWSSSNTAISTVSGAGVVTGVVTGVDTILYRIDSNGCSATATLPFKVRTHAACFVGVPITPGNWEELLSVYPNPNSSRFSVNLSSAVTQDVHYIITNMMGQKLMDRMGVSDKAIEINLNAPAGIYFVNASTVNGVYVAKVIVE